MKNLIKLFGFTVFITVIIISMAVCSNSAGGGGGDPPITYDPPELGNTPSFNGQQVYKLENQVNYVPYTGSSLIISLPSNPSIGSISTNGQLSLSLGPPQGTAALSATNLLNALGNNYTSCTVNPSSGVNYFNAMDFNTNASAPVLFLWRGNLSGTQASYTVQQVIYFYVSADVAISGTAKTITNLQGETSNYQAFNLALKAGWNTVLETSTGNQTTENITLTLSNPSNLKWTLEASAH